MHAFIVSAIRVVESTVSVAAGLRLVEECHERHIPHYLLRILDISPLNGIRIWTPAAPTSGMDDKDLVRIRESMPGKPKVAWKTQRALQRVRVRTDERKIGVYFD